MLHSLDQTVSTATAAAIAGVNATTVRGWRHNGAIRKGPMTLADVLSLTAASRLMTLGLSVEDAAAAAWAIKGEWKHILTHGGSLYLLISRTDDGHPVSWDIVTDKRLVHKYAPTAIYTNLTSVARETLAKLRTWTEAEGHG